MPRIPLLGKFFGNTVSTGAGYAAGGAVARTLHPVLQQVANEAWAINPVVPPSAGTLAAGVAQGQVDPAQAKEWARQTGYGDAQFAALVDIANTGPPLAQALEAWRRGLLTEANYRTALKRMAIEREWFDALVGLKDIRLSPSEIANAVQQGHMPNPGILPDVSAAVSVAGGAVVPVAPDGQPPSSVPLTQIDIDPISEAAAHGVTKERLEVEANLAGLPPGPEALLAMWNRNLIDEQSVDAGIREGHMKTKWAGAFKRMRWAVLTGQEYAEARLRDWVTQEEMYAGGALTGHTKEQMDLYYKNRGRTATPRQVWLAVARKVVGPNYPGDENRTSLANEQDHIEAIRRSNIRPEYGKMLWDIRFNYPPLFQLNRLVLGGVVDAATAAKWATYNLYAPEVVDALVKFWGQAGAVKADAHVTKAQTQLWGTIHKSYVAQESDTQLARTALAAIGVSATAQQEVVALWDRERQIIREALTPTQIKKAIGQPGKDLTWATNRLLERGYSADDAATFLAE